MSPLVPADKKEKVVFVGDGLNCQRDIFTFRNLWGS